MFLCAILSVFIATHGCEQGRIYFVVTCPNINSVHTCRPNQFAVVSCHFWIFKFWKTISPTGWIHRWKILKSTRIMYYVWNNCVLNDPKWLTTTSISPVSYFRTCHGNNNTWNIDGIRRGDRVTGINRTNGRCLQPADWLYYGRRRWLGYRLGDKYCTVLLY